MIEEFVRSESAGQAVDLTSKQTDTTRRRQRAQVRSKQIAKRHFLIISAPFGPFSRELAARLRSSGALVTRVLLNAGDIFDWGMRDAAAYFGPWSDWGDWIKREIIERRVSDIVTYGDSSPHAGLALRQAADLRLRSHVLEQGYFRPDWVTLEACGVNANSSLPSDPGWYQNHSAARQSPKVEIVGRTTPAAIRHIVAYHFALYLGVPLFPRFRAHYSDSALKQAAGHIARYGLEPFARARAKRAFVQAVNADGPVFLCVLQRPGDSQLWRHSDYASIPTFLNRVTKSFGAHAPQDAQLVIRRHPLDPGLVPYKAIVADAARKAGVEKRAHLSDFGKLHEILPHMAGVVCINSTAGLAAIEFGKPTIALGRANYNMPGLTYQGDLETFWRNPEPPDASLYETFRRVVMAKTQVNGAYATAKGRRLAVPAIAARMLSAESSQHVP